MTALRVSVATHAHLETLSRLWQERAALAAQLQPRYVPAENGRHLWLAAAEAALHAADMCLFVAHRDVAIVGYIWVAVQPNLPGLLPAQLGEVRDIAVDLHADGSGVGSVLLAAARGWFQQRGLSTFVVLAPVHSAVEQAFWRAKGAVRFADAMWFRSGD